MKSCISIFLASILFTTPALAENAGIFDWSGGGFSIKNPKSGNSISFGGDGSIDMNNRQKQKRGRIAVGANDNGGSVILESEDTSTPTQDRRSLRLDSSEKELLIRSTDRGLEVTLESDVLFDYDSSRVKPGAASTLSRLANVIRDQAEGRVLVHGHTDSTGNSSYNQKLSERRAISVMRFLRDKEDIPADILVGKGYGEDRPVAYNTKPDGSDNPIGRAQNRRVEVIIETQ